MSITQHWQFIKGYLQSPQIVGAVAPSSQALAGALCEPFQRHRAPARLLEVGAGTGPITRYLGKILGERDELDICEIKAEFVEILRRDVLSDANFAPAVAADRVRVWQSRVQDIDHEAHYDFVISGLPFNAFELQDVRHIFDVVRRCLKPGGVFSYFEYVGVRRASRLLSIGRKRRRIRRVSRFLSANIKHYQIDRRTVLRNLPPANARYLRFDD